MPVTIRLVIGLAGALTFARAPLAMAWEVSTGDSFSSGAVALLPLLVALVGCYLPARQGHRVNDTFLLRAA